MPQMIQQTMSSNMQGGGETESAVDKLKKLKELLDLEIISEEEFKQKKSKLMDHI